MKRIDEDIEFGCEERSADQPVMAIITLQDSVGQEQILKVEDQYLYDNNINEDDLVFWNEENRLQKWESDTEYFDICDENGLTTGKIVSRSVAHTKGICHRTAHIWVLRETPEGKVEVLLQKRSMNKDSFPGRLDTSSAGHIQAGDEVEESALRELEEELDSVSWHEFEETLERCKRHDPEYCCPVLGLLTLNEYLKKSVDKQ